MYIKDINTYFRHKLTKVCNILVQIYAFISLYAANIVFIYVHYIYSV